MNKKNENNKVIPMVVTILIATLVIIILLIVLLIKTIQSNNQSNIEDNAEGDGTPIYINETTEKIYPESIYTVVYRYTGNADLTKLYNNIYVFKEYVEALSERISGLNETEIVSYYENNKDYIKKYTSVNTVESFKKIVQQSQKIKSNASFEKAEMVIDTLKIDDEKLSCQMNIIYNDGTILNYNLTIYNDISVENVFSYEPIV